MANKAVKIRTAVDSVIYAPLYAFLQRNSVKRAPLFRFHLLPTVKNFEFSVQSKPRFLRPIEFDPVFSPIIDENKREPRTWFGVGDPLRVRRLVLGHPHLHDRYRFLGTLVSQLALWLITESRIGPEASSTHHYNYIGCHPEGMTANYVSRFIFRNQEHDPLAPVKIPGSEVQYLTNLLRQDIPRREDPSSDPVWFGAVSTEIDQAIHMRQKQVSLTHKLLFDVFKNSSIPKDYLFTALVARQCPKDQSEIDEAAQYLRDGILESIAMLDNSSGLEAFVDDVGHFFRSHRWFRLPCHSIFPWVQRRFLSEVVGGLRSIYPRDMTPDVAAMTNTDDWLIYMLNEMTGHQTVTHYFDQLKTSTWGAGGVLWKE